MESSLGRGTVGIMDTRSNRQGSHRIHFFPAIVVHDELEEIQSTQRVQPCPVSLRARKKGNSCYLLRVLLDAPFRRSRRLRSRGPYL